MRSMVYYNQVLEDWRFFYRRAVLSYLNSGVLTKAPGVCVPALSSRTR